MVREDDSNVIHLNKRATQTDKNPFLELAEQLVAEHASCASQTKQLAVGDGNLQLSSDPMTHQRIEGNGNIQIAGLDRELVRHLTRLGAFLKNQNGS